MTPIPLPALQDNCIWLLPLPDRRAVVVDPGDADPVLAHCDATGMVPAAILLTHHHPDHVAGTAGLLARWPTLAVHGPDDARIGVPLQVVEDGYQVQAGDAGFAVLAVPGHTRSHVAFHGQGVLCCGDTLFSLGCGRLFEGTAAQMHASLQRLAALPEETQVCCGHEYTLANAAFALAVEPDNPALRQRQREAASLRAAGRSTLPSTIALERAANPFLRLREPAVRAAVAARLGRAPADDVECFAALRAWKDGFAA